MSGISLAEPVDGGDNTFSQNGDDLIVVLRRVGCILKGSAIWSFQGFFGYKFIIKPFLRHPEKAPG